MRYALRSLAKSPGFSALVIVTLVTRGLAYTIRYETARVVKGEEIAATCESLLENPEVAYVHIRSKFNCFQCRVARSQAI